MVSNRLYISNYDFVSFRYSVFDGVSWITSQVLLHLCNAHPSYSNHKHLITHRSQPTPSEISPLSMFWVMMTTYLPLPLKKVTSFTSSLFIISCHYPVEPDIKLGALYSVDKMPDHCGSLFDHKKSKLVQLPIYDIDNKLIPTFQLSHRLHVGTIIMAKCSLQCYAFLQNLVNLSHLCPLNTTYLLEE